MSEMSSESSVSSVSELSVDKIAKSHQLSVASHQLKADASRQVSVAS